MSLDTQKIVTRIAPSPTGALHVGTARSALFNYLFARKHGGTFILRIEDTDKERSKKEFEEDIISGLEWLGLHPDETYRQSERTEIYTKYIQKLIEGDHAYISKEPQRDNPDVEVEVIRLKNPNKEITFTDLIRGDITFDTTELDDFVIARSKTEPLYHLTVVVDDEEMGVTHVIRGEDHISNTPRQLLIQEALDFKRPEYAHLPLILAPDRSKLSKRHGGAASINEYKDNYLPEAVVNYLALLGWNPGDTKELFALDELIQKFDITRVQKGGAIFDLEKLKSFNHAYIQKLSLKEFKKYVIPRIPKFVREEYSHGVLKPVKGRTEYNDAKLERILPELQERTRILADIGIFLIANFFYFDRPDFGLEKLLKEGSGAITKKHLTSLTSALEQIDEKNFTSEHVKESVWKYASAEGRAEVLWPMRYALTGKEKSPDPFSIAEVLGKKETLQRLTEALKLL